MSRGGDSQDALRAVWMEGYNAGIRAAGSPPVMVEIDPADIAAAYSHPCDHPADCPVCSRGTNGAQPQDSPSTESGT